MRSLITSIIGLLLIVGAVVLFNKLSEDKKKNRPAPEKAITSVFSTTVANQNSPIYITTSGQLAAKNKVLLFSEVQGIFEKSSREFKPGVYFKKGEVLLKLNSSEHYSNLQAQKSQLYNQIASLLPDLQLDFPESAPNWKAYLSNFDMNKKLAPLPEPVSEQENLFIAGRNIQSTWYTIENLQVRLRKHTIYAPFNGILTEADITPGTLVRVGQRLGEFIDPNVYEMEVPVNVSLESRLKVGKQVALHDLEHRTTWSGKVVRIGGKVDPNSQTTNVFIQVRGKGLKEGMFLEAEIKARDEEDTFEIDRKLLVDENKVFVIADTILQLKEIIPVFYNDRTVVIKGLENGTKIMSKPVPGAYSGMAVKILED